MVEIECSNILIADVRSRPIIIVLGNKHEIRTDFSDFSYNSGFTGAGASGDPNDLNLFHHALHCPAAIPGHNRYLLPKLKTVVCLKLRSLLKMQEGNSGWFGLSG